jgi:hypothetical protein
MSVCVTSTSDLLHDSVTKFTTTIVMDLVRPKAAAKHELLFDKLAAAALRLMSVEILQPKAYLFEI